MYIQTRVFGRIEVGPDAPYIKQPIQVNGRPALCGLYIADELTAHAELAERIVRHIDGIDAIDRRARQVLQDEFEKESPLVIDFLDFHLEELHDELAKKMGTNTIDRKLLLDRIELRAIGFHLEEDDLEVWFDYCPDEEVSDELLVVKFDANLHVRAVAHES